MKLLVTLAVLGCGTSEEAAPIERAPIEVRATLERTPEGRSGVLVVQIEHPRTLDIDLPVPVGSGLSFERIETPEAESLGERSLITQRFRFSGQQGHYEIQPVEVTYPGPDGQPVVASSDAIFLDLETAPIKAGEIDDITVPPPSGNTLIWVVAAMGAVVGGLVFAFWPRRRTNEVVAQPPLPPHLAALQAWERVRTDPDRSDEDKARALSVIFRQYSEGALRFEASAWTTSEILAHLRALAHLPKGNVPRAKRLLRATDRIKFAEERPTADLIDELDADLRAFIDATRPRHTLPRQGGA
ncbi:MAG: hypothetical protein AAGA48_35710 [Myxococcota bacterium]